MQCPNCGKTVDSAESFCGYCGAAIRRTNRFPSVPVLLGIGLAFLAIVVVAGSAIIIILRAGTPVLNAVAYATRTPQPGAVPIQPSAVPTPIIVPSTAVGPTGPPPTPVPIPATPVVIFVTATPPPSPTPPPTATPTPTPTPWFGFVSLRWEPSSPHWGDDVVFYAKFDNTLAQPQYLSWLIEICKPDCPNWTKLMFQTKRKDDTVPPGGLSEVVSSPPWPLRGQGGNQTYPVRFVHVLPDSSRIGESIFYITISPR